MSAKIISLHPPFSEAFELAKHAQFLNTITPHETLSEDDLQAMEDIINSHPNEFGCG